MNDEKILTAELSELLQEILDKTRAMENHGKNFVDALGLVEQSEILLMIDNSIKRLEFYRSMFEKIFLKINRKK